MAASIHPGDLQGLRIMELAKLTAVDMTATAVFNVLNNGNRTLLLTHIAFGGFSAYPTGSILPANFAYSYGLNSSTAPTDMRASGSLGAGITAPYVKAQDVTTTPAYIPANLTLYFAVTATTGAVGTMTVVFYGGILAK